MESRTQLGRWILNFLLYRVPFSHVIFLKVVLCTSIFPVCMYLHHAYSWYIQRLEEGIGFPWGSSYKWLIIELRPSARVVTCPLNHWTNYPALLTLKKHFLKVIYLGLNFLFYVYEYVCAPCVCLLEIRRDIESSGTGVNKYSQWLSLESLIFIF